MNVVDVQDSLAWAQQTIQALEEELALTNRGLVALALELEQRVDERTLQLRAAHEELERTNSDLLQLTLELESRVSQRTAELEAKTQELRVMSQQLWQTAKLATVGELAASIAHELNNPLATVSLRIESLLGQVPVGDGKRRPLEIIEQEVDRMGTLVSNLLQFSRRAQQQMSTLDVREEVDRTLELIHYHLHKHKIGVRREFAADVPMIQADRQQLRQLFLNLLTNAADAMPHGGQLTLRAGRGTLENKPAVVAEICDTGEGIAAENLTRVLEPFFTTKPEGKGTGLGLAICRRIVQEHGGTLAFQSELGRGTTVAVTLPVANGSNGKRLLDSE